MVNPMWENIFRRNSKEESIISKLKENILFKDLSHKELKIVENIIHIRHYRPGEQVFSQGETGVGMYIIVKGSINIFVEEITINSVEPKQTFVTRLSSGDFFGELALVEETGKRSATATSQEETTLIGFFKPDLMEIVQRNPSAGNKVLMRLGEVLGYRLKETTSKITELRKEIKILQNELLKEMQDETNL